MWPEVTLEAKSERPGFRTRDSSHPFWVTSRSSHLLAALKWVVGCRCCSEKAYFEVRPIFLDLDCKLVVLDVDSSEVGAFKLVTVYSPTGAEQPDFFRSLEVFLGTSPSLVLVVVWNSNLDTRLGYVGLADSRGDAKASHTCSVVSN